MTLATAEPLLRYHVSTVTENIGPDVPMWLDEFNWGGNWEGATTCKTTGNLMLLVLTRSFLRDCL